MREFDRRMTCLLGGAAQEYPVGNSMSSFYVPHEVGGW